MNVQQVLGIVLHAKVGGVHCVMYHNTEVCYQEVSRRTYY